MNGHGVEIRSIRFLRGPNLYAYMPVMHAVLDVGEYERHPSTDFPGFVDRIVSWLPGLEKHECSVGRPGGFVERLNRGTYLAHMVEHVTLELQNLMDFRVTFGRARGTGERGVYNVIIAYSEEEAARSAFHLAIRLVLAAMHDEPFDATAEVEHLKDEADRYRLGPSTASIVDAARQRNIPVLRVTPKASLVQLGWGIHQKRIQASETTNTSAIAVDMCQDKTLTNRLLAAVGVPSPAGQSVRSAEEAWKVAREIGIPVVVKPESGNQGKGVSVNLMTAKEVEDAYQVAREFRGNVLVEQYLEGEDYRLLVVNGKMVAAARRDPAQVVGDGTHTVRELVEAVNRDPRRRPGHSSSLTRIRLDAAADLALSQQGLVLDSVPEAGRRVKLRTNGNLSTGGTATDVTDIVHPANVKVAELTAHIMALDVAGVDVICRDISRPLGEQGGGIVEVNAAPGLRMHLAPTEGRPRNVGKHIVEMLYPDDAPSRIPIIAVTGTNGKTTVTRLIGHIYETSRRVVGMTSTEGIYIDCERIVSGDCSGPQSARTVLLHPRVEVAVLETARGGILREGLAFDRCSVGVVTNVSRDHMGLKGVNTLEELARVKQVVVESVRRDGAAVLNADDRMVAEMAAATDSSVVYFSLDPNNSVVRSHLASGKRCVFVQNGQIILADGRNLNQLIELDRVGFTAGGKIRFQVQNALAAAAAAWAEGVNPAIIARALSTFTTDASTVPGRFNVVEQNGVEIILDYAHNLEAMRALGEAAQALGARRTMMLLTLPGDRSNEDLIATFKATLPFVDEYVVHDSIGRRGRAVREIPELLASQVPDGVPLEIADDALSGMRYAVQRLNPGDRLIVIPDVVDEALPRLTALFSAMGEETACDAPVAAAVAGQ